MNTGIGIYELIQDYSKSIDRMILDAFELCGFSKDYIIDHSERFNITNDRRSTKEVYNYYYLNTFLFSVILDFKEDCFKTTVKFHNEIEEGER